MTPNKQFKEMKITKTNMQILQKCLLNRTWPNYPNNFVCYAHISSLIPIIFNAICCTIHFCLIIIISLHCIHAYLVQTKFIPLWLQTWNAVFKNVLPWPGPDIMTANAKYNIWMRMYNKCSMKDTLNWQNFWQCDWRDLKY